MQKEDLSEFTSPTLKNQTDVFGCNIVLLISRLQELEA